MNSLKLVVLFLAPFSAFGAEKAEVKLVSKEKPFLSDDGSVIRTMPSMGDVQSVHCLLPKDGVIQASRHKTVSQIWYVSAGVGEMWLKDAAGTETITALSPGTALTVPLGYSFEFRNIEEKNLEIFYCKHNALVRPGGTHFSRESLEAQFSEEPPIKRL